MGLNKRLFSGGAPACPTEVVDIFGDSSGVALYSLDYDASDASGSYDGAPTDATFGVGGKINYGARFNGSSSFINITDGGIGANGTARVSFSVSLWIKTTASNQSAIITDYGTNYGFYIQMESSASGGAGKLSVGNFYTGGLVYTTAGTAAINDGNWHNLVLVNNTSDNTQKLYIDGNTTPVISQTLGTGTKTANAIQVGYYAGYVGTYNFDGDLDQIRFLQTALNTSQIQTLYAETACVHTATTTNNNYPTTNAAYYKLDNSPEDSHGNTYDGVETDIEYRFGRFGQAAVFNGSSSHIATTTLLPTNDFTFSCWVNPNSFASSANKVIYNQNITNNRFYISIFDSGKIEAWNGSSAFTTSSSVVNLNQWHNIVYTADSTNGKKIYVDGVEVLTTSNTGNNQGTASGTNWTGFGKWYTNILYLDGDLDQVRIFGSALSASNVTELYNEKPETDTSNFKAVLYEGTSAEQYISNVGFQPDFIWIKNRDDSEGHGLFDSVRGANLWLRSNAPDIETDFSGNFGVLSFEENGFFIGNGSAVNGNNESIVAWNWKGGGDAVSNTQGTNITSSVSANTAAGFSIVEYTGTNNASNSAGHGLTSPPEIIIQKRTNGATSDWYVITDAIDGSVDYLRLNTTAAKADMSGIYSNFTLGSSTFSDWWGSGHTIINYCWHSVAGYSSIATYQGVTGNKVITTGFRPSFVIIKNTSNAGNNWNIMDSRRDTSNPIELNLWADTADTESTASQSNVYDVDFDNNGFTIKNNYSPFNANGHSYLYMAFK